MLFSVIGKDVDLRNDEEDSNEPKQRGYHQSKQGDTNQLKQTCKQFSDCILCITTGM